MGRWGRTEKNKRSHNPYPDLSKIFFFSPVPQLYISGVHHFWVRFLRMWPFFNPTIKVVTFRLRGWYHGACWVCFCCRHSPVLDMNVRIFWVCAMKCMCAQTRPWFTLSSERVLGWMEFEPMLTPRESKIIWFTQRSFLTSNMREIQKRFLNKNFIYKHLTASATGTYNDLISSEF